MRVDFGEDTMNDLGQISSEWLQTLENEVRSLPEIDRAAIIVSEASEVQSLGTVSVSDLVPILPPSTQPCEQGSGVVVFSEQLADKGDWAGRLALSYGGDLREPDKTPRTLPQTLMRAADLSPHEGIVYINSDSSTDFQAYPELSEDARCILAGLRKIGLRPRDKIIFQFANNRDFISTFWGCILGGVIPVPVGIPLTYSEISSPVNKLVNTWSMLGRPFIVTNKTISRSVRSLRDLMGIQDIQVITVEELYENEPDTVIDEANPEDTALMMLTSGSTGAPKGVLLSHKNLISRSAGSVQKNGFSSSDVTLNWMSLDHVAGIIYFHLRDVFIGCRQIHATSGLILEDPLKWIDLMDQHRVTVTFAPNFAFGLVNKKEQEFKNRKWDLSSVKFILNGGEAIVPKTSRKFMELLIPHGLPNTAMRPAWGMSETSSGVVYSNRFTLEYVNEGDAFVEVGEPIPGFSTRIVDERGDILEESKIGRLQVKGLTVMDGYYNNPQANAEAFTEDGWFDTGDLGIIRDGQLTIAGRSKDEIIINGVNYYPHEIESAVESVEGVEISFAAACAVRSPSDDTDKLAIFFSTIYPEWKRQVDLALRIRARIVREFGIFPTYVLPVEKKEIPKTEIGKIQRSQLGKRFVEGGFDALIGKMEMANGIAETVPNWFYRKVWIPASIDADSPASAADHYLIFMDDLGLGTGLVRFLDKVNQKYVQVRIGEQFAHLGENEFLISPSVSEHYDQLIAFLTENRVSVDTVVHLWNYSQYQPVDNLAAIQNAQDLGIYSLLALVRTLSRSSNTRKEVRLIVGTSHAQAAASDGFLAYEKSTLPGFLKAASLDLPWLQYRHIDFELTDLDGKYLLDEISHADSESEIAYRNEIRMRSCLSNIDMLAEKPGKLPLKVGGLYLITGGLGGLGCYLAERLMTQFSTKLILVGRTKLPECSLRDSSDQKDDGAAERMRAYENIDSVSQRLGGEFVYRAADISDRSQLETVVSSAESKWGVPLSGIFHLAGDLDIAHHWETAESHRVSAEGKDAFEAMFNAKVYGTWNLFQIIKERRDAVFVGFSSVVSELGAATFSAYCSGNSFLDGCCQHHHRTLAQHVYCFRWSMWEDMGMNKGNPRYAQQAASGMGNMTIEPELGWNSLLGGLCRKDHDILIGLNGLNPHIRARLDKPPEIRKRLEVYVATGSDGALSDDLREQVELAFRDSGYPFEIVKVNAMPVLKDGTIDVESLQRYGADEALASTVPKTDAEQKIAAIWKEVLGVKKVRTDVNFFDSGGTSIQLAQINGQLKSVFGRNISMTDLFQFPTISSLAEFLTSPSLDSLSNSLSESKDRAMERRDKMLSHKRGGKRQHGGRV